MRTACVRLLFCLSVALVSSSTGQGELAATHREPPRDTRPFGKYLYALCTVSRENGDRCQLVDPCPPGKPGNCSIPRPGPAGVDRMTQTISISLVCDPDKKDDCHLEYPVVVGHDFYVQVSSDSGQEVEQHLESFNAHRVSAEKGGVVRYHADSAGTVVVTAQTRVAAPRNTPSGYVPAAPVDLMIQAVQGKKDGQGCSLLSVPSPSQDSTLDATGIVSLIGNPTPFTATAESPNVIAIYTNRQGPTKTEKEIYRGLVAQIGKLSNRYASVLGVSAAAKPFTVELRIPHAGALGDLATRLGSLNYSKFTVQDVGRDSVRITAAAIHDCDSWTSFLTDIKRLEWSVASHSMSTKLFYLSSSDVGTAFTSLSSSGGSARCAWLSSRKS